MMLFGLRHWLKTRQSKQTTLKCSKTHLLRIATSYKGITGNVSLDQNGDRKYGDYEYWIVGGDKINPALHIWKPNPALHIWKPIGRFIYNKTD